MVVLIGLCVSQIVRRLLANLPTTAQALCPSPFLDANLFVYDDKLISPVLRMRAYVEQPLKFSSRTHPAACRFKVSVMPYRAPSSPQQEAEAMKLTMWGSSPRCNLMGGAQLRSLVDQ